MRDGFPNFLATYSVVSVSTAISFVHIASDRFGGHPQFGKCLRADAAMAVDIESFQMIKSPNKSEEPVTPARLRCGLRCGPVAGR